MRCPICGKPVNFAGGGYSPYCSKECADVAEKEFEALLERMSDEPSDDQPEGHEEESPEK